jgi:putative SOS response-associated peptidase YedK
MAESMCGRYTITSSAEAIRAFFRYEEQTDFPARYNIAPTQPIPVVRLIDGKRQFALMRWGLVPSWVKDPATFSLLVNARGESVCDKPAFRSAMKYRRCLIPADGFYEWQASGQSAKQPFYISGKTGGPLAFAGLYETWTGPNGEEVDTAAIVTTRANQTLAPLHDRMPVILTPEAFDLWLNCTAVDARTAEALIAPAPDDLLQAWPVSRDVNRTANDRASLIAPVRPEAETPPARTAVRGPRAKPDKADDGQGVLF